MPLTADQAGQGQLRPSARAPLNKDEALVASHARCCDATLLLPANQQQPLERYDYTSLQCDGYGIGYNGSSIQYNAETETSLAF